MASLIWFISGGLSSNIIDRLEVDGLWDEDGGNLLKSSLLMRLPCFPRKGLSGNSLLSESFLISSCD